MISPSFFQWMLCSSARELMLVCFAAERPTFNLTIRSDSPMPRKLLAGSSGSLSVH